MIVGVNKYQSENSDPVEALAIDASHVQQRQEEKLKELRNARDAQKVKIALDNLTRAARRKIGKKVETQKQGEKQEKSSSQPSVDEDNLLTLSIEAAKARCTVGEISEALEKIWGRYLPTSSVVSGAYAAEYANTEDMSALKLKIKVQRQTLLILLWPLFNIVIFTIF